MSDPAGLLPVDKPEGPTSHDIVAAARRALGIRRIGHTGTLDPFASGLLLLAIGSATRLVEYLADLPKTYRATLRLGAATDTDDRTGDVTERSDSWRRLSPETVRDAVMAHVGTFLQTPPQYSARKVGGHRMYRLARQGIPVNAPASEVTVHAIVIERITLPDVEFEITCSTGTYIRAIARDIGIDLRSFGYLETLRRVRIGPHAVENAIPVGQLGQAESVAAAWISPLAAVRHLPVFEVSEPEADQILHGVATQRPAWLPEEGATAVSSGSRLIAVAEIAGGWVRPRKVFT
jgi:tRNA pseudouridine55 synthase